MNNCFWEVEGVRSLFGKLRECDRSYAVFSVSLWFVKKGYWEVEGMR
ncbi:hypothetical protein [Anabaena sp. UHCC 0451]|nr:hypothetical protein [Anabaena sp. UHCC 0451]MEA5577110.1 hypothetical protein [Anabaena sp. UHCC 0451]